MFELILKLFCDKSVLSEDIKSIRMALGFTQEEFSKKIGASRTAVQSWERGISEPSLKHLRKICSIHGIDIAVLVSHNLKNTGIKNSENLDTSNCNIGIDAIDSEIKHNY